MLYLPVDERVEFKLTARDVIHSFWIPAFLCKLDMIPGVENTLPGGPAARRRPIRGKCAELCGEYHSEMLFKVKVVEPRGVRRAHGRPARARARPVSWRPNLGRSPMPDEGEGASRARPRT